MIENTIHQSDPFVVYRQNEDPIDMFRKVVTGKK